MKSEIARIRVDVRPHLGWWEVRRRNHRTIRCLTRRDAVDAGAYVCRFLELAGDLAQLRIWTRLGRIAEERTYPDLSPQRKG